MDSGRLFKHILLTVLFLAPAVFLLQLLGDLSAMPSVDYWTAADQLLHDDGLHLSSFFSYFIRLNEHVIPVTGLIYAFNIVLTGGSNLGLIVVAFIASFFSVVFLYRLLPEKFRDHYFLSLACGLCISLFIFSCAPYPVWYEGFSGVHWQVATFFIVLSLFWFHDFAEHNKLLALIFSLLSATLACLTYSSAYVLWPVLFCLAILYRFSLKNIFLILLSMTPVILFGVYFAYYFGFEVEAHPVHNPHPLTTEPKVVLEYFLTYMGAYFFNFKYYFTKYTTGPVIVAIIGLSLFVILSLLSIIRNHRSQFPWIGLAGIALGNGILTVLIRGGFGTGMMIAPRFKCITALFWLSLFVLFFSTCLPLLKNKSFRTAVFTFLLLVTGVGHTYFIFKTYRAEIRKRSLEMRVRDTAALSFQLGTLDQKIFETSVTRNVPQMNGLRSRLIGAGHVPFRDQDRICPEKQFPTEKGEPSKSDALRLQKGKKVIDGLRITSPESEALAPFTTLCIYAENRSLLGRLGTRNLFRAVRSKKERFSGYLRTQSDASGPLSVYGISGESCNDPPELLAHISLADGGSSGSKWSTLLGWAKKER